MTCHHCEDAPAPVAALMAQSATLMTAFRSISKSVLAVNPAWWPVLWYDANRPDTRRGRKVKATAHKCDLCAGAKTAACVENCPAEALQLVTDVALSGMAKSRRFCAPRVRNINRGMPVPRRKKCR
ncbi:4Fe-4S dicluster domain-containing protein [Escherichia coli]